MSAERAKMESQDVQQGQGVQAVKERVGELLDIARGRKSRVDDQFADDLRVVARRTREAYEASGLDMHSFARQCDMSTATFRQALHGDYDVRRGPMFRTIAKLRMGGVFLPEYK